VYIAQTFENIIT